VQERKVGDFLIAGDLPLVQGEDSLIEVASAMIRTGSPLIAVLEGGRIIGGITLRDLLAQLTR
jgi:CBS domain-containing protein